MKLTALKICGLTDPLVARQAVQLGVDYIGLVFHEPSKRHLDLEQAIRIADAVHEANGLIVPVFVNQSSDEMLYIADQLQADVIQLHSQATVNAYTEVSRYYPCIVVAHYAASLDQFSPERDFLLYDSPIPGSGQQTDWNALTIDSRYRFFIAGGINRDNIVAARDYFHPFGLDISTGVESSPGVKEMKLIENVLAMFQN